MKNNIVIIGVIGVMCAGCTVPTYYSKTEVLNMKRNPDVVSIDNGNLVPESRLAMAGSIQMALSEEEPRTFNDTVIVTKDFNTLTTYINSNIYESGISMNLDAMYGIKDELAIGANGDFSFKSFKMKDSDANKTTCDIGFYLRAVGDIYNLRLGVRPEIVLSSLNGHKTLSDSSTYDGEMHYYYLSERLTIFARYTIIKALGIFGGIQQKRVVFMEREDALQYENVFGGYAGLAVIAGISEISPYVTIPISSDYTRTHSPMQFGIKTIFTMKKLNLKTE
jgi:hypothetical protein